MGKPKQHSVMDSSKFKQLPGKAVRYIGILGAKFVCPTCERSGSRMLVWEHENKMYCSRRCIEV